MDLHEQNVCRSRFGIKWGKLLAKSSSTLNRICGINSIHITIDFYGTENSLLEIVSNKIHLALMYLRD